MEHKYYYTLDGIIYFIRLKDNEVEKFEQKYGVKLDTWED